MMLWDHLIGWRKTTWLLLYIPPRLMGLAAQMVGIHSMPVSAGGLTGLTHRQTGLYPATCFESDVSKCHRGASQILVPVSRMAGSLFGRLQHPKALCGNAPPPKKRKMWEGQEIFYILLNKSSFLNCFWIRVSDAKWIIQMYSICIICARCKFSNFLMQNFILTQQRLPKACQVVPLLF